MPREAHTVAVGFDGSPQSRDALALGTVFARLLGDRLAVVFVSPTDPLVDLTLDENQAALREAAEAQLAEARVAPLEGLEIELHTPVALSDARGLHDTAEALAADVLVVGPSHRSGPGRVLPGSVGTRLLHGSPCAVGVAPAGYADAPAAPPSVIQVAFDGSPESELAVADAAVLARAANATVRIVGVADPAPVASAAAIAWSTYDDTIAARTDYLRKKIAGLCDDLPGELRPDGHVATGHPATVILEEAAKGADLLVVGSRGYGAIRRVMLGSVSAELLRSASCPVLVTPRGSRAFGADRGGVDAA